MRVTRACCLAVGLLACGSPAADRFSIAIDARDELGAPLDDVGVWLGGDELGMTDELGRLVAARVGRDGERVTLSFTCPAGRRTDAPVRTVPLRRIASPSGAPAPIEVQVACAPVHTAAPLVVTATGPGDLSLPLTLDGEIVAHTDETGTAHVLLEIEPGAIVRVGFDTTSRPELRPRHPSHAVRLDDTRTILLVSQRFDAAPRRRHRAGTTPRALEHPPADPSRPYRIH